MRLVDDIFYFDNKENLDGLLFPADLKKTFYSVGQYRNLHD